MKNGGIIVISGPSGVGKTTLYKRLLQEFPDKLAFSISATTRPPRPGEKDGIDYYFFTLEQFNRAKNQGEFAEWAEVYGNYYGTLKSELIKIMESGKTALLDVDVQGGMSIKSAFPEAYLIFILPPSFESLKQRIIGRCSDDPKSITCRLQQATKEIQMASFYDCCIENDDLEKAYLTLRNIILSRLP